MERIEALLVIAGLLILSIVGYAVTSTSSKGEATCPAPPSFNNFNAGVLHLSPTAISTTVGKSVKVTGEVESGSYSVNGRECPYYGRVSILVYEGPQLGGAWNVIVNNLTAPNDVKVLVSPGEFYLPPKGSVDFNLTLTPLTRGSFHIYVVAVSDRGWRAWAELNVTAE